jgi:hexosaminidase
MCAEAGLALPANPEGYSLLVRGDAAAIAANTETGVFYGLTTLLQLSALDKKGVYLKGAEIVDYPALAFRGVHCLSGKNAGDQIAKAIRTLMARFKMNSPGLGMRIHRLGTAVPSWSILNMR